MVLNPKATHIAYRCPDCGYITQGVAGSFGLGSQDMLRLRCTCGAQSELSVIGAADHRIRLAIPCLLCGHDHQYTLSDSLFYGKDIFRLACPYTDIDIGFFGRDREMLREATEKSTEELTALYESLCKTGTTADEGEESEDRATADEEEEPFLPDYQIYDIVRFLVKELEADGQISCPCRSGAYDVEMTGEGIRVFCPECHASYLFKTNSLSAAQDFLSCDSLSLE